MAELTSLHKEVRRLHEDHKILNNNMENLRKEEKFDVQQSPYKVSLVSRTRPQSIRFYSLGSTCNKYCYLIGQN